MPLTRPATMPVTPLPPAGPGSCTRCRGPARPDEGECWCCRHVGCQLGLPAGAPPPVVAVGAARPGDAFHGALRRYKDAPGVEQRRHYAAVLGRLVSEFVVTRRPLLAETMGEWDAVAPLPSSGRASRRACPLETLLPFIPALVSPTVVLRAGPARAAHLRATPDAFVVPDPVQGRRVLVFDDVWVTGARARSAAAALTAAGAEVAGILVIARVVRPDATDRAARWWEQAVSARPARLVS
ncbi:MAG: hypothetical protein ACYDA2_03835 [Acidimicrobiales bacterium]